MKVHYAEKIKVSLHMQNIVMVVVQDIHWRAVQINKKMLHYVILIVRKAIMVLAQFVGLVVKIQIQVMVVQYVAAIQLCVQKKYEI